MSQRSESLGPQKLYENSECCLRDQNGQGHLILFWTADEVFQNLMTTRSENICLFPKLCVSQVTGKRRSWCNNHCFSGNQEEVTQREQLRVQVDRGGQAAAGNENEISIQIRQIFQGTQKLNIQFCQLFWGNLR